jgi:trehalose 6-phosphate phosphatase
VGIERLPHTLRDGQQFVARVNGRRPAVFLDYDGTLTPIVDRPEGAVIADSTRAVVRRLARHTTVADRATALESIEEVERFRNTLA